MKSENYKKQINSSFPKLKLMINSLNFFDDADEELDEQIHNWENEGGNHLALNTEMKFKPKKIIEEYKKLKNK